MENNQSLHQINLKRQSLDNQEQHSESGLQAPCITAMLAEQQSQTWVNNMLAMSTAEEDRPGDSSV